MTQFVSLRLALTSALHDSYWSSSRRDEHLWRISEAMRQRLEDLQARRGALAGMFPHRHLLTIVQYGMQLQVLHVLEQVGLPHEKFAPLEPHMPKTTYDSLLQVKLRKQDDVAPHCRGPSYDMVFPPPFKISTEFDQEVPVDISAWLPQVTQLVKTTPIPQEPKTSQMIADARSLLSQLRCRSNPVTGHLAAWMPLTLVNMLYGYADKQS